MLYGEWLVEYLMWIRSPAEVANFRSAIETDVGCMARSESTRPSRPRHGRARFGTEIMLLVLKLPTKIVVDLPIEKPKRHRSSRIHCSFNGRGTEVRLER